MFNASIPFFNKKDFIQKFSCLNLEKVWNSSIFLITFIIVWQKNYID